MYSNQTKGANTFLWVCHTGKDSRSLIFYSKFTQTLVRCVGLKNTTRFNFSGYTNTKPSRRDNLKMCVIVPLLNNNCPSSLTMTASLSPHKFDLI